MNHCGFTVLFPPIPVRIEPRIEFGSTVNPLEVPVIPVPVNDRPCRMLLTEDVVDCADVPDAVLAACATAADCRACPAGLVVCAGEAKVVSFVAIAELAA